MKKNSSILAFIAILALVAMSCGLQLAPVTGPQPDQPQPGQPQPGEPQPGQPQPGQPQPGEPQPGEPQPGEPRPEEPQPGQPGEVQIVPFNSSRASLNSGECAILEWNVQGGFGVSLSGEQVQPSGQKQVCPPETTTYRLEVDTGKTILHQEVTITVTGAGQPQGNPQQPTTQAQPTTSGPVPGGCAGAPAIPFFNANPTSINSGQSSTLSWGNVTNGSSGTLAKSVKIEPGLGEVGSGAGSRKVNPTKTTTYTLTATGCGGTSSKQVTVTVNSGSLPITPIPGQIANIDLAVTNIYPAPNGHIMVTLKNTGNTVINTSIKLTCTGTETIKSNPPITPAISGQVGPYTQTISFNLKAGEKFDQDTQIGRTPTTAALTVTCSITPPSGDTNGSNNSKGPVTVK